MIAEWFNIPIADIINFNKNRGKLTKKTKFWPNTEIYLTNENVLATIQANNSNTGNNKINEEDDDDDDEEGTSACFFFLLSLLFYLPKFTNILLFYFFRCRFHINTRT